MPVIADNLLHFLNDRLTFWGLEYLTPECLLCYTKFMAQ